MSPHIELVRPERGPALCGPVLRSVPDWFGIESATRAYIEATGTLPTWVALDGPEAMIARGFLTIHKRFPHAAEIHCVAVHRDSHGKGIGTALVRFVEDALREGGVRFLQVKTMGPSRPNAQYAMTTRFYLSVGFEPVEEFIGLWNGLPALQLIKTL